MNKITEQAFLACALSIEDTIMCRPTARQPIVFNDTVEVFFSPHDIDAAAIEFFSALLEEVSHIKGVKKKYQNGVVKELIAPLKKFAAYVSRNYCDVTYDVSSRGCLVAFYFANVGIAEHFALQCMDNVYADELTENYTIPSDEIMSIYDKIAEESAQMIGNQQLLVQEAVACCIKQILEKAKRLEIQLSGYCHTVIRSPDQDVEVVFRFPTDDDADAFVDQFQLPCEEALAVAATAILP